MDDHYPKTYSNDDHQEPETLKDEAGSKTISAVSDERGPYDSEDFSASGINIKRKIDITFKK